MSVVVNFKSLNTVAPASSDVLEKLHTRALLKRLQALHSLQDSYEVSDWTPEERDAVEAAGLIAFKHSDHWRAAYAQVKAVLATREHVPRGGKAARQQAARQKQNR